MTKRTLDDAIRDLAGAASSTHLKTTAAERAAADAQAQEHARIEQEILAAQTVFRAKFEKIKAGLAKKHIEASIIENMPSAHNFIDSSVAPQKTLRGTNFLSMTFQTGRREKDQYGISTVPTRAVIRILRINEVPVVALCAAANESGDLYKFLSLPASAVRDDNVDLDAALVRALDEITPRDG